jgi:hypothetical protein
MKEINPVAETLCLKNPRMKFAQNNSLLLLPPPLPPLIIIIIIIVNVKQPHYSP